MFHEEHKHLPALSLYALVSVHSFLAQTAAASEVIALVCFTTVAPFEYALTFFVAASSASTIEPCYEQLTVDGFPQRPKAADDELQVQKKSLTSWLERVLCYRGYCAPDTFVLYSKFWVCGIDATIHYSTQRLSRQPQTFSNAKRQQCCVEARPD